MKARELLATMKGNKWVHSDALDARIAVMDSCAFLISGRLRDMRYDELVKNVSIVNNGGVDLPFQMRCDLFLPQVNKKFEALAEASGKVKAVACIEKLVEVLVADFSDLELRFSDVLSSRQSELRLLLKKGLVSPDEQREMLDAAYEAMNISSQHIMSKSK